MKHPRLTPGPGLDDRDESAALLAASMPEDRDALLIEASAAVVACHAAVMASDGNSAEAACARYDAVIWKLNGGTYFACKVDNDAAGKVVERHCQAVPGSVPMWGQTGEFLVNVGAVRALVVFGSGFGSLLRVHYEFHAIDLDGPFISETGYRSHFDSAKGGQSVIEAATAIFADFLNRHRRYLPSEVQGCLAGRSARSWLVDMPAQLGSNRFPKELKQETGPLPDGFVLVDVVLTTYQAFTVKKWAEAAKAKISAAVPVRIDTRNEVACRAKVNSPASEEGDQAAIAFRSGQKCQIVNFHFPCFEKDVGKVVIVTKVHADSRQVWVHDDRPVTYRKSRNGRMVVDFDPSCIQTLYSMDDLRVLE